MRSRFGSDRTGRSFAWLYDYDAGSMDAQAGQEPPGIPAKPWLFIPHKRRQDVQVNEPAGRRRFVRGWMRVHASGDLTHGH